MAPTSLALVVFSALVLAWSIEHRLCYGLFSIDTGIVYSAYVDTGIVYLALALTWCFQHRHWQRILSIGTYMVYSS